MGITSFSLFVIAFFILTSSAYARTIWKIPVLYWSMKIEGQVAMRKGFEEEIEKFNKTEPHKIQLLPHVAGEGRRGILNQITQFDEALKSKPNAIVIQPTDNSALARGLQEANSKGIPVIAYDQYIVNGHLASFLTSDNYQGGVDNGDYINKVFRKDQHLRIVVFEYPQVSSTIDRVDGFFDSLRKHGRQFSVLKRYQAVEPIGGEKAAKQFLKDFPEKGSVDLILTVNDGGGLSVVKALWNKKRTEIHHATFDGDPASVENIKNGRLTIIDSAQFCAELGRETARTLIRYLKKEKVPAKILVPTYPVTIESLKSYPGWMGRPIGSLSQPLRPQDIPRKPQTKAEGQARLIVKFGVAPLCPYLCEKGPGVWGGYIYDILKEIADDQGIILQMESISNTRLVANLLARKVNYIIAPSYLVRYLDDVRIVGPSLGMSYTGALVPLNSKESLIDSETLLNKKTVFADVGIDGAPDIFDSAVPGRLIRLTGADVADRMIKMLNDRRVDIALGDYNVLSYSLGRRAGMTMKLVPTSLTGYNSLVLVSVPHEKKFGFIPQHLHNWFLRARQTGDLEKTLSKYNLADWHLLSSD